jgi:DNA-binding LacI/PurR family transcriptional regulator
VSQQVWRRARQADIARLAGVSQATVSYVINAGPAAATIPRHTTERILAAARDLGYVVNPAARKLAGGKNRLIGVYTFEPVFPVDYHDFYHPFLVGIEQEAARHSYDLLMFTSATGSDGCRSIYRDGVNRLGLSDGCVLLGRNPDRNELARLRDDGFPFIFIGRREVPGDGINYVAADYAAATSDVVDHLAGLGHRRLAYLCAPSHGEYSTDRDAGFWSAVERHNLDVTDLVRAVDESGPTPEQVRELLDNGVTALVLHDAAAALRTITTLTEIGVQVPRDCSIAALSDPPNLGHPNLDSGQEVLTCFHIPRMEMGQTAIRMLLDQLAQPGREPHRVALPCRFAAGRSTGVAPDHSLKGKI